MSIPREAQTGHVTLELQKAFGTFVFVCIFCCVVVEFFLFVAVWSSLSPCLYKEMKSIAALEVNELEKQI